MASTWVRGSAVALAGFGVLLAGTPVWADTSATLRSGQAPTTAVAYSTHSCDDDLGGGPYTATDVWSFVLPDRSRRFVSVTAGFDTTGDGSADTTVSSSSGGGDGNGTSKTWIAAPAGATLLSATAVVTGSASSKTTFNLNRTCPAIAAAPASPSASARPPAAGSSATSAPPAADVVLPGANPARSTAGGRGAGAASSRPGVRTGEGAGTGPEPESAQGAQESSNPRPKPVAVSSDRTGMDSLTIAACAVVGSVACAFVVMAIRRRRIDPPARIGRHHLAPLERR